MTVLTILRIGLLSDVHYGSDTGFQKGTYAPLFLRDFVKRMEMFKPQIIVELGDRINNIGAEQDRIQLTRFRSALLDLTCSFEYVLGNHDIAYLTKAENEELVGEQMCSLRHEIGGGFSLIYLDSEDPDLPYLNLELLEGTKRTVFVFSHRPLLPVNLKDNILFMPGVHQHCPWGEKLLMQLVENGYYPVCIHGHLHWNYCLVDDPVIQVCIPSLVDSWEVGTPSGSFGEMVVEGNHMNLDIKGLLPAHYCFRLKG